MGIRLGERACQTTKVFCDPKPEEFTHRLDCNAVVGCRNLQKASFEASSTSELVLRPRLVDIPLSSIISKGLCLFAKARVCGFAAASTSRFDDGALYRTSQRNQTCKQPKRSTFPIGESREVTRSKRRINHLGLRVFAASRKSGKASS